MQITCYDIQISYILCCRVSVLRIKHAPGWWLSSCSLWGVEIIDWKTVKNKKTKINGTKLISQGSTLSYFSTAETLVFALHFIAHRLTLYCPFLPFSTWSEKAQQSWFCLFVDFDTVDELSVEIQYIASSLFPFSGQPSRCFHACCVLYLLLNCDLSYLDHWCVWYLIWSTLYHLSSETTYLFFTPAHKESLCMFPIHLLLFEFTHFTLSTSSLFFTLSSLLSCLPGGS